MKRFSEYTASVGGAGSNKTMVIVFNASVSDDIHDNEYVAIILLDKIILREPKLSDSNVKKLRKRKLSNTKEISIGGCKNKEMYYGLYDVELSDCEIILTKRRI